MRTPQRRPRFAWSAKPRFVAGAEFPHKVANVPSVPRESATALLSSKLQLDSPTRSGLPDLRAEVERRLYDNNFVTPAKVQATELLEACNLHWQGRLIPMQSGQPRSMLIVCLC